MPLVFFEARSDAFCRFQVESWAVTWAEVLVALAVVVLVEAEGGERFEVERLPFLPASVARGGGWQVR